MMDLIEIEGLEVDCIVGVRPQERRSEQRIRLDLSLHLNLSRAGRSGRIADTYDYDRIADEVISLLRFREYQLIEVATEELSAMLLGVHSLLEKIEIRLVKPAALRGRARSASVKIVRESTEFPRNIEKTSFGEIERLLETREVRLSLIHVNPEAAVPPSSPSLDKGLQGSEARELEWLIKGALERNGETLNEFDPRIISTGENFHYFNSGSERATLFRVECLSQGYERGAASIH